MCEGGCEAGAVMDACMWMFLQMGLRAFGYLCVQVCMCMCAHVYVCAYVCVCALCMFVPNSIDKL